MSSAFGQWSFRWITRATPQVGTWHGTKCDLHLGGGPGGQTEPLKICVGSKSLPREQEGG